MIPAKLYSKKSEIPVSFAASAARRTHMTAAAVASSTKSPQQANHNNPIPRSHATIDFGCDQKPAASVRAGRHVAAQDGSSSPPLSHVSFLARTTSPPADGRPPTVGTQTCASLASVGLLSEETQTELDLTANLLQQGSFNEFNPAWGSTMASPRGGAGRGRPSSQANRVVPSLQDDPAQSALYASMSDHHAAQRDTIMMADLVIREAKLQQALQKLQVDHEKELAREQSECAKMEALASKNGDLLRAERLQHEVAMNELRVALEHSKKLLDAQQQQLSIAVEESAQLKRVISAQEEASVRAAKDQSKKIVEAMEKHLVRQHDESQQRNASRIAEEQRRYQERREEWLRTMRKEGSAPSAPPPAGGADASSRGTTAPLGADIAQSRSLPNNVSTTMSGPPSPFMRSGSVNSTSTSKGEHRSPRMSLLMSSDAVFSETVRRGSGGKGAGGLSPMSHNRTSSLSQPPQERRSKVPAMGHVVATATNVRRASKRLSKVLHSPMVQQPHAAAEDASASPQPAPTSREGEPRSSSPTFKEALEAVATPTRSASRRPAALPNTTAALPSPWRTATDPTGLDEPPESASGIIARDIADRCLQGGEPEEEVGAVEIVPAHDVVHSGAIVIALNGVAEECAPSTTGSVPAHSSAGSRDVVGVAVEDVGDASFLGRPKRNVRSTSLFSGEALHIMKEDMLSQSASMPPGGSSLFKREVSEGESASTTQRQTLSKRREQTTKQLESSLRDVERLTTFLKERNSADTLVDAEQRLQQCSDALKAHYDAQYTASVERLKKREREISELFTNKAAALETELTATSATVQSLHESLHKLQRENESLTQRVRRAESTKDSQEKLQVLQRALLSVGADHLCCLCRESVLRDEVQREYHALRPQGSDMRAVLQVKSATLMPCSPPTKNVRRHSSRAHSMSPRPHTEQTDMPPATNVEDASVMIGAKIGVTRGPSNVSLVPSAANSPSIANSLTTQQEARTPVRPATAQLAHAIRNSQSPYAVGFHESVQEDQRRCGPPTLMRLEPCSA